MHSIGHPESAQVHVIAAVILLLSAGAFGAPQPTEPTVEDVALMDAGLAANTDVVLRVAYVSTDGADKYAWYRVRVLRVLKNKYR